LSYPVRYDGTGLTTDGYVCYYDTATGYCYTDAVIYDGTGLKPFGESVARGQKCTGGNYVVYDGTGLKPISFPALTCGPI